MEVIQKNWKDRLHETIFESNTTAGKTFDIALLVCILMKMQRIVSIVVRNYRQKRLSNALITISWRIDHSH